MPDQRRRLRANFASAADRFSALYESWVSDSLGSGTPVRTNGSWLDDVRRAVVTRHDQLLERHRPDVDKYLYQVPLHLAKVEDQYSWHIRAERRKETDRLLDGILGREYPHFSLGLLVRAEAAFPDRYSRAYLAEELERRLESLRSAPKPGFQSTLDYAKGLDGVGFEDWLVRLLRDSGIGSVARTPASRDQGADLIVNRGARRIVIQAKQYQGTVGNAAVQEVVGALHYYKGTQGWVVTTSIFSKDAIDLARRAGVQLVDGYHLLNLPQLIEAACKDDSTVDSPPEHVMPPVESTGQPSNAGPSASSIAAPPVMLTESVPEVQHSTPDGQHFRLEPKLLALIVAVLLGAGLAGYLFWGRTGRASTESAVKSQLAVWAGTMLSGDVAGQVDCYGPVVSPFFQKAHATRNEVAADKAKMTETYPDLRKYILSDVTFQKIDANHVVVSLDKEWGQSGRSGLPAKSAKSLNSGR